MESVSEHVREQVTRLLDKYEDVEVYHNLITEADAMLIARSGGFELFPIERNGEIYSYRFKRRNV